MKKWLLLLLLVSCIVEPPGDYVEPEVVPEKVVGRAFELYDVLDDFLIRERIEPYSFMSSDALYDTFGIVPVEHYQALYQGKVNVLVRVFKFSSRNEVDYLLRTELDDFFVKGAFNYDNNHISLYVSTNDASVALWPNREFLIIIESSDFVAQEILEAYLAKYPSDYVSNKCKDSDGSNHNEKGTTSRMVIDNKLTVWTDVCIQDYDLFKSGDYKSVKGMREGLLEGLCKGDYGHIDEYPCPRGCRDGACVNV